MCRAKNDVMIDGKDKLLVPEARLPKWEYRIGVRVSSEGFIHLDPSLVTCDAAQLSAPEFLDMLITSTNFKQRPS